MQRTPRALTCALIVSMVWLTAGLAPLAASQNAPRDYKSSRDKNPEVLRAVAQSLMQADRRVELKTASGRMRGKLTDVSATAVTIVFGNDRPSITTVVVPLADVQELNKAGMPRALKAGILLGLGAFALIMLGLLAASAENSV